MSKRNRRFTVLPCGLKIRLDIYSGDFDLIGDMGFKGSAVTEKHELNIVCNTRNLLALAAFFLAKAEEARERAGSF